MTSMASNQDTHKTIPALAGREPRHGPTGFIDDFSDTLAAGRVLGTTTRSGVVRQGVDKERLLGIDNGALRIQPLAKPRWGRAALSYGPYQRHNGLTLAVSILNGHNTSQTGALPDTFAQRIKQWLLGAQTESPLKRMVKWTTSRQRRYFPGHLCQWAVSGSRYLQTKVVDENLAVGWFPNPASQSPLDEGNSLVMHAAGPECGELWARSVSGTVKSVRGVQNVPMYYIVVLRERGAAYYAASVEGVPGFSAFPNMTPLGIDSGGGESPVYAGVHQSVLGQIGFRVDTRVYRVQVATVPALSQWFGSAALADRFKGAGTLESSAADTGGQWRVLRGGFERTPRGLQSLGTASAAIAHTATPAGLVHVVINSESRCSGLAVLFRVRDGNNYFGFELGTDECALLICVDGCLTRTPSISWPRLAPNVANAVQITDDGAAIRLSVNGELAFGGQLSDIRFNEACGVGIASRGMDTDSAFSDFEAHPRAIPIPEPLDLGAPWQPARGLVVATDDFAGPCGTLEGRITQTGGLIWRREIGIGEIQLTGTYSARVKGSVAEPCPGRTAYTVPWTFSEFADISVRITPPGTRRGNRERGRGGLIFWQDADNYITFSVFVDDWYGTSIAAFFYRDGYEELYDAVWTNVGRRIQWGVPYDFRVVFDSVRFTAFVNGEPVLHRALHDVYADWYCLPIQRVGIVANWEWGSDTGTTFERFAARGPA